MSLLNTLKYLHSGFLGESVTVTIQTFVDPRVRCFEGLPQSPVLHEHLPSYSGHDVHGRGHSTHLGSCEFSIHIYTHIYLHVCDHHTFPHTYIHLGYSSVSYPVRTTLILLSDSVSRLHLGNECDGSFLCLKSDEFPSPISSGWRFWFSEPRSSFRLIVLFLQRSARTFLPISDWLSSFSSQGRTSGGDDPDLKSNCNIG